MVYKQLTILVMLLSKYKNECRILLTGNNVNEHSYQCALFPTTRPVVLFCLNVTQTTAYSVLE